MMSGQPSKPLASGESNGGQTSAGPADADLIAVLQVGRARQLPAAQERRVLPRSSIEASGPHTRMHA